MIRTKAFMRVRRTQANLLATAYHEAGHAVVAFKLGIRLHRDGVTIEDGEGYSGLCATKPRLQGDISADAPERMKTRAERQVMVFLAGLEAQRKHRVSSVRSYHAHGDYLHAVDYLSPFSESMEEVNAWLRLLMIRTMDIMNSEVWWGAIEGLARMLMEKRTLSGREAEIAIGESLRAVSL
jgi:hypothetical protein